MPKKTNARSSGTIALQFADIPTPAQLYDTLMAAIEPDLVRATIPTLAATYAGESPEQTKARMKHYRKAFQTYKKRMLTFIDSIAASDRRLINAYRRTDEAGDRQEETDVLQNIEASIAL